MISLNEVRDILASCTRSELRDHAFGDREIFWRTSDGEIVAEAYDGSVCSFHYEYEGKKFTSDNEGTLKELFSLGITGVVERNDSTGPDEFTQGVVMPGLSEDDILKELIYGK